MEQALTVKQMEPIRERFTALMPDPVAFEREASFAVQILQRNDYLAKCSQESIMRSVLNVAQIGLSLNPVLKLAYLVPRWSRNTRSVECYLEPGYQGLVKLLTDTKTVVSVEARIVWEGDQIEVDFASADKVTKHVPYFLVGKDPGQMRAVYALAVLHDGSRMVEIMSQAEVHEIRERSESYKKTLEGKGSSIWLTDPGEMWRKTAIRRLFKYLPKSGAYERVAQAVELDHSDRTISDAQWNMITRLVHTAEIPDGRREAIEREMHDYTSLEASTCINYLMENQPPANGFEHAVNELNSRK